MIDYMAAINDRLVRNSDEFFAYRTPTDFRLEHRKVELFHTGSEPPKKVPKDECGELPAFHFARSSPRTPRTISSTPAGFPRMDAAPWCSCPNGTPTPSARARLCRIFNLLGIAALRLEHAVPRCPPSSGTDARRLCGVGQHRPHHRRRPQGIVDIRSCLDWLEEQGYTGSASSAPAWARATPSWPARMTRAFA